MENALEQQEHSQPTKSIKKGFIIGLAAIIIVCLIAWYFLMGTNGRFTSEKTLENTVAPSETPSVKGAASS